MFICDGNWFASWWGSMCIIAMLLMIGLCFFFMMRRGHGGMMCCRPGSHGAGDGKLTDLADKRQLPAK